MDTSKQPLPSIGSNLCPASSHLQAMSENHDAAVVCDALSLTLRDGDLKRHGRGRMSLGLMKVVSRCDDTKERTLVYSEFFARPYVHGAVRGPPLNDLAAIRSPDITHP